MSTDLIREARVEAAVMRKPPIARPDRLRLIERLADALERAEKERDERETLLSLERRRSEMFAAEKERLREELMRCGSLAVSNRIDGSLGKRAALHIREIAHRTCWPDDDEAELRREAEMPC